MICVFVVSWGRLLLLRWWWSSSFFFFFSRVVYGLLTFIAEFLLLNFMQVMY